MSARSGTPDSVGRAGDERNALSGSSAGEGSSAGGVGSVTGDATRAGPSQAATASASAPPSRQEKDGAGVLARPVVIGASVSAGAASRDHQGRTVDLAVALDGWITSPHPPTRSFASSATFLDPVAETKRQVEAATQAQPSIVFALDVCFWPVNAKASSEAERLARLDSVLAALAAIDAPLVLGDVPDRDEARTTILAGLELSAPATRIEANERIRAWAAARPHVVLVPLAEFVRRAAAGEELRLAGATVEGETAMAFLAPDRLHASALGVSALAGVALDELVARGLLQRTSLAPTLAVAIERRAPIPGSLPIEDEANVAEQQVVVVQRLVDARKLLAAQDPAALERGIELVEMVPSRLSSPCEMQLVRDLAAMSSAARRTLESYLATCALRAVSADARPADYARWVLVAAGLRDTSAMRAAAQAYRDALTRNAPRTSGEQRLADSAYDALDGTDDIAAGLFWPDPESTMKRWQREADDHAAALRAAGIAHAAAPDSVKGKAAIRRAPPARGARLVTYLRAAGREDDATNVEALLPTS